MRAGGGARVPHDFFIYKKNAGYQNKTKLEEVGPTKSAL
jgi:hypothetical protein